MDNNEREKLLKDLKDAIELETQIVSQEYMITKQNQTWDAKKP